MPEPGLSDILSVATNSGSETGSPATLFDNRQLIDTLTTAARQKSDNDIKRYHLFLDNLNGLSQDAQAIAGMDIMPGDREALEKQANDIFSLASKNPDALSGRGADGIALREKLAKWKSDATLSKQNYTFDFAHRKLLEENPSFETEENKKQVEDYTKQPLGQRKEYLLNMPTQLDFSSLSKGILDSPFVKQKYAEKTPDGELIQEGTKTKYDAYVAGLDASYSTTPDIRKWSKERYTELPEAIKKQYQDKDGNPDYRSLYLDLGKGLFVSEVDPATGKKKDIVTVDRVIPNQFKLAEKRADERLKQLEKQFDYNKRLESIKQGGKVSLELLRQKGRGKPAAERKKWLQQTTDAIIQTTIKDGKEFDAEGFKGKIMPVSTATLKLFNSLNALGKPESPKDLIVNPDGSVTSLFYTKDKNGKIKMSETDKLKSKTFPVEEFKARFGKDILGIKETSNELSDDDIDVGDDTDLTIPQDDTPDDEPEVSATVDLTTLKDGNYKIKDGKNKGKIVTIKDKKVSSIK